MYTVCSPNKQTREKCRENLKSKFRPKISKLCFEEIERNFDSAKSKTKLYVVRVKNWLCSIWSHVEIPLSR